LKIVGKRSLYPEGIPDKGVQLRKTSRRRGVGKISEPRRPGAAERERGSHGARQNRRAPANKSVDVALSEGWKIGGITNIYTEPVQRELNATQPEPKKKKKQRGIIGKTDSRPGVCAFQRGDFPISSAPIRCTGKKEENPWWKHFGKTSSEEESKRWGRPS